MSCVKALQAFFVLCLAQGLHFKALMTVPRLQAGSEEAGSHLYASPFIGQLMHNPLLAPMFHSLGSIQTAPFLPMPLNEHSALQNQAIPASNKDQTESRSFWGTQQDTKPSAVNITNSVLRTVVDQPVEMTSKQLQDSLTAITASITNINNLLQKQSTVRKCPTGLYSLGVQIYTGLIGTLCYGFASSSPMTRDEAVKFCKGYGFDGLRSFETEAEVFLFTNSLGGYSYWTSGSDASSLGTFTWETTGKPVNYTNWAAGEPKVRAEPSCIQVNSAGKWITVPCATTTQKLYPMCELRNVSNPLLG